MKISFCLILCFLAMFCGELSHADDLEIKAAEELEKENEYALAFQMLASNLRGDPSVKNALLLIDFNERILDSLETKISRRKALLFKKPEDEADEVREMIKNEYKWFAVVDFFTRNDPLVQAGGVVGRKIARNELAAIDNHLPEKSDVISVMEGYDVVKESVLTVIDVMANEIKRNRRNIKPAISVLRRVRAQKDRLKKDRTDYLSYTVISPCLWEAARKIYLADSDYLALKGKDKVLLDHAVVVLAYACHKQWLFQSSQDVRAQFVEVQRMLKQVASRAEMEDYSVLTTLSDTLDPTKPRGADAWMK